jgi:CRISPR-associated protein Csb2
MIAIKMRFLAGRFHATPWGHHVNEGVVEYPPSLFRLLRSLIATARRACLGQITEEQLSSIVTALNTPPQFHLPQAAVAHTRHYDQANAGVKFFDTFVALRPEDDLIWLWPGTSLNEIDSNALSTLLTALGTFGRAESWCEAELLEEREAQSILATVAVNSLVFGNPTGLDRGESIRLLLPLENLTPMELMKVLETETSSMRKAKQLEPTGTRWLTYTRPAEILTPRRLPPSPVKRDRKVISARLSLDSNVLPLVTDALPFAEQVRRALIRNRVDTSHSEAITGKYLNGVPLAGHEHAHYFATDENGDGRLDHVTVFCPRGFDEADVEALGSLRTIYRRGNRPEVRMILLGLGGVERLAQRGSQPGPSLTVGLLPGVTFAGRGPRSRRWEDADRDVCAPNVPPSDAPSGAPIGAPVGDSSDASPCGAKVFATSKRWRSVTPFSLPRFPNRGGGKPPRPRDLPEAQLVQELVARGLPEPISIGRIEGYQPNGRPLVRWLEFHTQRFKGTQGKGVAGFEIEFAEPVSGPIAVGFGCHFGLGLFMPN